MDLERGQLQHVDAVLSRVARFTLDLVFPLSCLGCKREGAVICENCAAGLKRLEKPYCERCAQPGSSRYCGWCLESPLVVDTIRAPFIFEGPVREGVHRLKYRGQRAVAASLARLMAEYAARSAVTVDLATPVPMHPSRLRKRGYNHSYLLAQQLGKILGLPVEERLLSRVKDSPPQVEARSREERQSNVAGSFRCQRSVDGLTVLLVDDVATTGSTLSECAAALKSGGAKSVRGLVLAREV